MKERPILMSVTTGQPSKTGRHAVREKPILFSSQMVRAILAGTKTQTRRISNPHQKGGRRYFNTDGSPRTDCICPYGAHGDLLWVREAFRFLDSFDGDSPNTVGDRCLIADYPKPWAPTHLPTAWRLIRERRIAGEADRRCGRRQVAKLKGWMWWEDDFDYYIIKRYVDAAQGD